MIVLIPAKLNSKNIKNKNLQKIGKLSLLENTINFAKKVSKNIFVSTESEKIKKIALKHRCFIHMRKGKIAKRNIEMKYVINDFIHKFKYKNNLILLLQPTSPFRKKKFIINAINLLYKKKVNSVFSVSQIDSKYFKSIYLDKNYKVKTISNKLYLFKNRQNLPKLFSMNGNFFLFKSKFFLKEKEIPVKKCEIINIKFPYTIDIDNSEDLAICRKIYKNIT